MIRVHRGPQLPDPISPQDTYFLPGYGQAASVPENGGEWVLLEALDGAWQIPLILRPLPDNTKDAISPYGYSGIYAAPTLTPTQIQHAWTATLNTLQDLTIISVLLRHSPLVPQPTDIPGLHPIISGHPTRCLQLVDETSAWDEMEGRCRTSIRKALKNGYTADIRQANNRDLAASSNFRRLYDQTMRRRAAASSYTFGDDYYQQLLNGLGADLLTVEVQDHQGVSVSAALLMFHAQRLHYHLSGSTVGGARMGSNNLMLWTATQFAIDQGLAQFHLGGGVDPRDDLYKFKRSFGGHELKYDVSGVIVDQERYQTHTQNRAKEFATTTESLLNSNYFPAYRGGTPVA